MLNRIVLTEKNQIATLKVVDELRHVDIQPAMHALEGSIASSNSQKVNLDLNNLQVISHDTQELLGLLIRHVRLQNIPITISGSSQLDPAILLSISEGRPQIIEQQQQLKDTFTIKPKYFSRFSTPFFSKEQTSSGNQLIEEIQIKRNSAEMLEPELVENQPDAVSTVVETVPVKYTSWMLFGWIMFFSLTGVSIVLLVLLWPDYQSGKIEQVLLKDNSSTLAENKILQKNEIAQVATNSSLMLEVKKQNLVKVQLLLDAGVDLELRDQNGYTPLMQAVKLQNKELVKLLVVHGANVDIVDDVNESPLVWATSLEDVSIAKLLLSHGANPDKGNFSPLMWAAFHGNYSMLTMLLKARANLNARTHEGWTALMWAAERGNLQALWELLKRGAEVNMQNNKGQTALMLAAGSGRLGAVGLLLNNGGDSSIFDFEKKTAVNYAIFSRRKEILQLLENETKR
ncbi:MAG: ankyrin repeat domain-containing protein [SAR324 cluster bacterium]|nr:ankyrin repeat domain-containing protein [SAR324 cluster bacterium]MBL7034682.1 ankyrin repeat domain-containing protein [SAR324 cluster bacterium]